MPEGHTIHRAARDHHLILARQKLIVSSPQGKFSEGASLLNEQICSAVEAFGKHLLYKFNNEYTLHIHLGLFGRIRKQKLPLAEPKSSVRIRLIGKKTCCGHNWPNYLRGLGSKRCDGPYWSNRTRCFTPRCKS